MHHGWRTVLLTLLIVSAMRDLFDDVEKLEIDGQSVVRNLDEPAEFVNAILDGIAQARDHIILSALYLGTGATESAVVDAAEKALTDMMRPNLRVTFILDHSRSQRGAVNSVTMLSRLVNKFDPRAAVYLYQMPQLRGYLRSYIPLQLREVIGVYHCKFAVFDDTVILTGANLSHDYFTDRQDRYFLIAPSSSGLIGNRVVGTENTVTHDEQVLQGSEIGGSGDNSATFKTHNHTHTTNIPVSDNGDHVNGRNMASYLTAFVNTIAKECHEVLPGGIIREPVVSRDIRGELLSLTAAHNNAHTCSGTIAGHESSLNPAHGEGHSQNNAHNGDTSTVAYTPHTCIYPIMQHSPLDIHQESNALNTLCNMSDFTNAVLCIATPYANFRTKFLHTILSALKQRCSVELTTPTIGAHGFGSATGVKGLIPAFHFYSLQCEVDTYMQSNTDAFDGGSGSGELSDATYLASHHYMRPAWTYHTKGIWLFPDYIASPALTVSPLTSSKAQGEAPEVSTAPVAWSSTKPTNSAHPSYTTHATQASHHKNKPHHPAPAPVVTYIGSSNFGDRSWTRDFELGFVIATTERPVQDLFRREYSKLQGHCGVGSRVSGVFNASVVNSAVKNGGKSGGAMPVVPAHMLPQHTRFQQWVLYAIARVMRSFL